METIMMKVTLVGGPGSKGGFAARLIGSNDIFEDALNDGAKFERTQILTEQG